MDVEQILSLLPEGVLEELAVTTKVNRYSKKLQGELVFKLLLHCILSHKDNSLRTMASAYESLVFSLLNSDSDKGSIRYSSISERLSTINPEFFEQLYFICVKTYSGVIGEQDAILTRFDSTIVSLSGHLLKTGYQLKGGDAEHLRQLKFTIGLSEIPTAVFFFHDQEHTSENIALKEAILSHQPSKSNTIRVFDRGVTSRKTHDELTEKKIPFVSRINANSKQKEITKNGLEKPIETETLLITSDNWVLLYSTKGKAKYPQRCIKAIQKVGNKEIVFITNIIDLTPSEITELYKCRWDIEVFFKFIKQELNFSHLINRSENGIKVMLYVTMIAAILLLVYKKKNNLTGFKIMKQKFVQELEKSLVREIVVQCGGSLDIFEKKFGKPPK